MYTEFWWGTLFENGYILKYQQDEMITLRLM